MDEITKAFNAVQSSSKNFDSFKMGWEAYLLSIAQEKAKKTSIKKRGINFADFVIDKKNGWGVRHALLGYLCDGGYKIATDGTILLKMEETYPEEQEKKIINPLDGEEVEGTYPNYKKVIPDVDDMEEFSLSLEDLKIIRSASTSKSVRKLKDILVEIGDYKFSLFVLDRLMKVRTAFDGKLYCADNKHALSYVFDKGVFVFQPLYPDTNCQFCYKNGILNKI